MVYDCFSGASPLAKARQVCLHASVWSVGRGAPGMSAGEGEARGSQGARF